MGATGVALLDFGAFPGDWNVSLDVAAPGVIAASAVEAWIFPADTADHTADEHRVEDLRVSAVYKANDVITITGIADHPPIGGMDAGPLYGKWNIGWVWV